MFESPVIRHGDPTSTGGVVIACSSTLYEDGRRIALSGDEATCGNCKGAFKIYGSGNGMSENSRDVVIQGDRVLCPCGKNRVFAGGTSTVFMRPNEDARRAEVTERGGDSSSPSIRSEHEAHTCWVLVRDHATGKPLAGRRYITGVLGINQTGTTDSHGYAKLSTDRPQGLYFHLVFSTPGRNLSPED